MCNDMSGACLRVSACVLDGLKLNCGFTRSRRLISQHILYQTSAGLPAYYYSFVNAWFSQQINYYTVFISAGHDCYVLSSQHNDYCRKKWGTFINYTKLIEKLQWKNIDEVVIIIDSFWWSVPLWHLYRAKFDFIFGFLTNTKTPIERAHCHILCPLITNQL